MFPIIYRYTTKDILHEAAASGDIDKINALIRGKKEELTQENFTAYINKLHSIYGITPLALASEFGHLEIVEILLEYGADVSVGGLRLGRSTLAHSSQYIGIFSLILRKVKEIVDNYPYKDNLNRPLREKAKIILLNLDLAKFCSVYPSEFDIKEATAEKMENLSKDYLDRAISLYPAIQGNTDMVAAIEYCFALYYVKNEKEEAFQISLANALKAYNKTDDMLFMSLASFEIISESLMLGTSEEKNIIILEKFYDAVPREKQFNFIENSLDTVIASSIEITPLISHHLLFIYGTTLRENLNLSFESSPVSSSTVLFYKKKVEEVVNKYNEANDLSRLLYKQINQIELVNGSPINSSTNSKATSSEIFENIKIFIKIQGHRRLIYLPTIYHSLLRVLFPISLRKRAAKESPAILMKTLNRIDELLEIILPYKYRGMMFFFTEFLENLRLSSTEKRNRSDKDSKFFHWIKTQYLLIKIHITFSNPISAINLLSNLIKEICQNPKNVFLKKSSHSHDYSVFLAQYFLYFLSIIKKWSDDKKLLGLCLLALILNLPKESSLYLDSIEEYLPVLLEEIKDKIEKLLSITRKIQEIPDIEISKHPQLELHLKSLIELSLLASRAFYFKYQANTSLDIKNKKKNIEHDFLGFIEKKLNYYRDQGKSDEIIYYYGQALFYHSIVKNKENIRVYTTKIQESLENLEKTLLSQDPQAFIKIFDIAWNAFSLAETLIPLTKLIETLIILPPIHVDPHYFHQKIKLLMELTKKTHSKQLTSEDKERLVNYFTSLADYLYKKENWQEYHSSILKLLKEAEKIDKNSSEAKPHNLYSYQIETKLAQESESQNKVNTLSWYEKALFHLPQNNQKDKVSLCNKIVSLSLTLAREAFEKREFELSIFYYQKALKNIDKDSNDYQFTLRQQILVREEIAKKYLEIPGKYYKVTSQYYQAEKELKKLSDKLQDNETFKQEFINRKNVALKQVALQPDSTIPVSDIPSSISTNLEKNPEVIDVASIHPLQPQLSRNRRQRNRNRNKNRNEHIQKQDSSSTENRTLIPTPPIEKRPSFWKDGMFMGKSLQSCFLGANAKIRPILDKTAKPIQKLRAKNPYLYKRFKTEIKEGNTTSQGTGKNGSKMLENPIWECKIPGRARLFGESKKDPTGEYILYNRYSRKGTH